MNQIEWCEYLAEKSRHIDELIRDGNTVEASQLIRELEAEIRAHHQKRQMLQKGNNQ